MCSKLFSGLFGEKPELPAIASDRTPARDSAAQVKNNAEVGILPDNPKAKKVKPGSTSVPGLGL